MSHYQSSSSSDSHNDVVSHRSVSTATETQASDASFVSILFVENKSIRQYDTMVNAAKAMTLNLKMTPEWITIAQIKELKCVEPNQVFVTDPFKGHAYEYLISIGARIIGPLVILNLALDDIPKLPLRAASCPISSLCMRKLNICVSGFDRNTKEDLKAKIERMCGAYSPDLTSHVTHLVTDTIGSKKYYAAFANKRPVMTSRWIYGCYAKYQHQLFHANDKSIIEKFKLSIFNDVVICVSQISKEERQRIKSIVEKFGGKFKDSLDKHVNYLLLPQFSSGDISKKIEFAINNNIPIINKNWIYESLDNGYSLKYEDFLISFENQIELSQQNCDSIPKMVVNGCGDTPLLDRSKFRLSESIVKPSLKFASLTAPQNGKIIENIQKLTIDSSREPFLEGCTIHVHGFDRTVIDAVKNVVLKCRSLFMDTFKQNVTHVIIGPNAKSNDFKEMSDSIALNNSNCNFVAIEWLFECIQRNDLLECNNYRIDNHVLNYLTEKSHHIINSPPIRRHNSVESRSESSPMVSRLNRTIPMDVEESSNDWPVTWTQHNPNADTRSSSPEN